MKIPSSWLACPVCKSKLKKKGKKYVCKECKEVYSTRDDIPIFLPSNTRENQIFEFLWKRFKPWTNFIFRTPMIRDFISLLDENEEIFSGKILEIGAGGHGLSSIVKINRKAKIITTDISFTAIKYNIQTAKFIGKLPDFYAVCDFRKLPFVDNLFDCVFGASVINHLESFQFIKEINRVIKPGGYYVGVAEIACSKFFSPIFQRVKHFNFYERMGLPRPKTITREEYKKGFRSAGFKEVRIDYSKKVEFHAYSLSTILYYLLISPLPDFVIDNFLCSRVHIIAKK